MKDTILHISLDSLKEEDDLAAVIEETSIQHGNHINPDHNAPDTVCLSLSQYEQTADPYASYSFEIKYSFAAQKFIVTTTRYPQDVGSETTFDNEFADAKAAAGYIASYGIVSWFNNALSPDQQSFLDAIRNDNLEVILSFSGKGVDINQKDINGNPYIITAVRTCASRTIETLLTFNPDPDITDANNNTALLWAIIENKNDIFRLLIQHGANIQAANNDGENGLMLAASGNNAEALMFFLKNGFDAARKNNSGQNALTMAISTGCDTTAGLLIKNGAALTPGDATRHFIKSCESGYSEMAELLLQNGAAIDGIASLYPNIPHSDLSGLMNAAYIGHTRLVDMLIKKGADINCTNSAGKTALMFAAEGNNVKAVKLLLDAGAGIEDTDKQDKNSLYHALESFSSNAAGYLIRRGARFDSISEPTAMMKECMNQMEAEKERLEDNIRIELESSEK